MPEFTRRTLDEDAQLIRAVSRIVPDLATRSTTAIVASKNRVLRQLGSGTLLAVADHRFIVTAAHVVLKAIEDGSTLAVSGASDGRFIPTAGTWLASPSPEGSSPADIFDVAIYQFSEEQASRLDEANFIRIGDVCFDQELSSGYFVVTGFPGIWSDVLSDTDPTIPMTSKMLQYGTVAFQGSTTGLNSYDKDAHLLLDGSPALMLDQTGNIASFRTNAGFPAQMPRDLAGISGCSVWLIGDLRSSIEQWSPKVARLVGVETGVYPSRGVIKATRWSAVTTLLYNSIPMLRPALRLYDRLPYPIQAVCLPR